MAAFSRSLVVAAPFYWNIASNMDMLIEPSYIQERGSEIKSTFIDRKRGESSISLKLILVSLFGIIKLYFNNRKQINSIYRRKII